MELEGILYTKYVRGLFAIGAGGGRTRIRSVTGMSPETIYAVDGAFASRLGAGLGISPVMIGPIRPVPYAFYNYNWGPDFTSVTSTRELGVDVEFVTELGKGGSSAFFVGVAMISESGQAQAELTDIGSYDGSFKTTGLMVTFGWHLLIDAFNKN
jgi:hypothetical protein